MSEERLQKILAQAGVASRRAAEALILAGRVRLNGRVVSELGVKADPRHDKVELDGVRLVAEAPVYLVLHKPRGVVATLSDPEGRPTVKDYLKDVPARVYPVGRLDFATSGVLLVTNDGDFSLGLLHPRCEVAKCYVVKVSGKMQEDDFTRWSGGVELEDGPTKPAGVTFLRYEGDKTWFELTIEEGRNQQIRRMGEATGFQVMRLSRVSFAGITSEGLRPGAWRHLTRDELMTLRKSYGVPRRVPSAASREDAGGAQRGARRTDGVDARGRAVPRRTGAAGAFSRGEGRPEPRPRGGPPRATAGSRTPRRSR
jgi:23S rRNA pseudouridine2605 synthase